MHHRKPFLLPAILIAALVLSACSNRLSERLGLGARKAPEQQKAEQVRLDKETGVVVVRMFRLHPGMETDFVNRWQKVAEYLKQQPGYITTTMHRSSEDFKAWNNKSQWESRTQYEAAISTPHYRELFGFLPEPVEEKVFLVRRHGDGNLRIDHQKDKP